MENRLLLENLDEKIIKALLLLTLVFAMVVLAGCAMTNENAKNQSDSTPSVKTSESQNHKGKRIYFAAPLFSEAEREYNLKIVHVLESYGYEVFLPQRDGFLASELEGLSEKEKTDKIFAKDKEEVLKSDILFILLDGRVPDEGACVELGIAYGNGKKCYGIKSDSRSVEKDMDLNPMITGCLTHCFYNLNGDELLKSLNEYLKNNEL